MEKTPQSFDVCIVCAMPEEARAFLEVIQPQCENALEECTSPRYQYNYRFAALKNSKDEILNVHISWLPRYGPQEMALHLSHVLEECRPRIAIMTGICAGDAQQVQLGDLVVAERTFTYDSGKFALDDYGRTVHLHDTMTYQLDANILQFLGLFNDWKQFIVRLENIPSSREPDKVACHIKAMASGSAVRADHPFEEIQVPVRNTVAIDMEGAAFGLVMSRYPMIRWLVVKGVCDYADQNKNDAYHDYAARASACYAVSFIKAYVTYELLPRLSGPPREQLELAGIWNVPYLRNQHFTGREELLDRLTQQLSPQAQKQGMSTNLAALTQPQAIKGLGGIGKTQVAVEYAYRSRELNRYTHIFWVNAASKEALLTNFARLAELLPAFPAKDETDQLKLVEAIKQWLEHCQQSWLLIFDNADDIALLRNYLPQWGNGSILLTTRANAVSSLVATSIEVDKMGFIEGTQLLLRRAQRSEHASDEETNQAGNIVVALDHFPLALDQAGAYIDETNCSFTDYLEVYQKYRTALLARRGEQVFNYPDSVATTWSLSFQKVQQANPATVELLYLCAFLAPDQIPEELIKSGADHWSLPLQQAVMDDFTFNQIIFELLKFSLIKRNAKAHFLSIHRLVQAVLRDTLQQDMQRCWAERVIQTINDVLPFTVKGEQPYQQCLHHLDHIQACKQMIEDYKLKSMTDVKLLNQASLFLGTRARLYAEAESCSLRALAICEQQLGSTHPDMAITLNNLACVYREQKHYWTRAEPLFRRALAIREQQLGDKHPDTATTLNDLANLYKEQGRLVEAEPLFRRALAIFEQELEKMGLEAIPINSCLRNAALVYEKLEHYAKAEVCHRRALEINERWYGPEASATIVTLMWLQECYQKQKKYGEEAKLSVRILAFFEQEMGSEDDITLSWMRHLAYLYTMLERYAEAESLYQRVLIICEEILGSEHPDTATALDHLAYLCQKQKKYEKAEELYQRALVIREQKLGREHPDTALTLDDLAELYCDEGKYEQAEPLLERLLRIYTQQLEPGDPLI